MIFLTSLYLNSENVFSHLQNAWQNECPEEFVEFIYLVIPSDTHVDNPIEDAAFMARIGAKKICDFSDWFELKNAVTVTRFTFTWNKIYGIKEGSDVSYLLCSLRREEKIVH